MEHKRYQWSIFIDKDQQVVVRNDDWKEFIEDIESIKAEFGLLKHRASDIASEGPKRPVEQANIEESGFCQEHEIVMKKNKNGHWYHREFKAGMGTRFCNGYQWADWIK